MKLYLALLLLILVSMIAGIVALNVWDYRRRRKLTREERKQEDRESDAWLSIW